MMVNKLQIVSFFRCSVILIFCAGFTLFNSVVLFAHGGRTHQEEPFSSLQAAEKAIKLYDRLIISGKLPQKWETRLATIEIKIRGKGNQKEYMVQFRRSEGEPNSVYFYFDRQGEYSGSNFTGE